ncbi:MAG: hypothetical protein L0H74_07225, partial [Brachybacterium sp.]|nr:hypothetical protein [Brachybacterium sp.]
MPDDTAPTPTSARPRARKETAVSDQPPPRSPRAGGPRRPHGHRARAGGSARPVPRSRPAPQARPGGTSPAGSG